MFDFVERHCGRVFQAADMFERQDYQSCSGSDGRLIVLSIPRIDKRTSGPLVSYVSARRSLRGSNHAVGAVGAVMGSQGLEKLLV